MGDLLPESVPDADGTPRVPVTWKEADGVEFGVSGWLSRDGYDETDVDDFLDRIIVTLRWYEENDPWAIAAAAVRAQREAAAEYEAIIAGLRAEVAQLKRRAAATQRRKAAKATPPPADHDEEPKP